MITKMISGNALENNNEKISAGTKVLMPYFDEIVEGVVVSTPDQDDNLYTVGYNNRKYRFNLNELVVVIEVSA